MMAFTKKPTQPPDMDTKAFVKRLRELFAKVGLGPYQTFNDEYLPVFHRWVRSEGEFDGTGLRDVVNANAYAVDDLKEDLDGFKTTSNLRYTALAQRVSALEGAATTSPFPGSG
jgi:hypothetical protein